MHSIPFTKTYVALLVRRSLESLLHGHIVVCLLTAIVIFVV